MGIVEMQRAPNRRQILLGSAATVAAVAMLPIMAVEQAIMPFADPSPELAAVYKFFWDSELDMMRVAGISARELYINGD